MGFELELLLLFIVILFCKTKFLMSAKPYLVNLTFRKFLSQTSDYVIYSSQRKILYMNQFKSVIIFTLFSAFIVQSQSLSAIILEKGTGNPIPYAAVKIDDFNGVITNEEGLFTVNINQIKFIEISCLGFKELRLTVEDVRALNYKIELQAAVNQLNEVIVSNKLPSIDSIIANVRREFKANHQLDHSVLDVFSRETSFFAFDDFEFDVKKASTLPKKELAFLKQNADSLNRAVLSSNSKKFQDFSGKFYSLQIDSTKLTVDKLTNLVDLKNDYSVDLIQDKAQKIFLKVLDTNLTYKVKTGIFKVEDSLDMKVEDFKDDNLTTTTAYLKSDLKSLLYDAQILQSRILGDILDTKAYQFYLRDITYTDGNMAYILDFVPNKGKSKFAGTLIIMDNNFAVKRLDYTYASGKRGTKVNLKLIAGVKFVEEAEAGTIHFSLDINGLYKPFYMQKETRKYVYVNRPFTFIENSISKNKFGFNITMEGRMIQKSELLFTGASSITAEQFETITEAKTIDILTLSKYTPSVWEDRQVLEPVEEMRSFTVEK